MSLNSKPLIALLAALWIDNSSLAQQANVDYVKQVKPVLVERCLACHGALKQEGGLRLDTVALAIQGGESGPALVPGEVDSSRLLKRVMAKEETDRMPPEGEPLKPDQIAAIRNWIAQNATGPVDEKPDQDPRDHWAFKAPVRPVVPKLESTSPEQDRWNHNPVDRFIAKEHRNRGLVPQPEADRRVWLRRVSLDLSGLPPTLAELDAFVADSSPDAHDKVVTRLLDSPQYGERWGRHWMDVWRYSDWWGLGAEVRNSQKHIWHWRDWIVESLNVDKGYDQMLREMLAADELYPNDIDRLRASGFLARQYFKFNRTSWLDETVEHTSKAMLGLTVNCAKCHDHKYDPIAHADYYRLRAIFEPYQVRTDFLPGEVDPERDGLPRAFDCNLDAETFLHIRGDDRNPDKSQRMDPAVPAFLTNASWHLEPIALPADAYQPSLRPFVVESHIKAAEKSIEAAKGTIETARKKLVEVEAAERAAADEPAANQPTLPALNETSANLNATEAKGKKKPKAGDKDKPFDSKQARLNVMIAEKALAFAIAQSLTIPARAAAEHARIQPPSIGDAASLAQEAVKLERIAAVAKAEQAAAQAELDVALADDNKKDELEKKRTTALAAVDTAKQSVQMPAENFTPLMGSLKTLESNLETEESRRKPFPQTSTGRRTALAKWMTDPKHPLPARVAVNHIWMRHMGKPLVPTVFDFGLKGTPPTHPELLDWLAIELIENGWSMKHLHRLIVTSQAYRMSSSNAGASVDIETRDPENRFYWRANPIRMEAQSLRDSLLHLAGELDLTRGGPSIPANDENSRRRSLYFVHSHNEHQKFLSMFDDASVLDCYRRAESIVPQQALALENSKMATAMGEKIAQRISKAFPDATDPEFIRAAFLTVLSVEPSSEEQLLANQGLTRLTAIAQQKKRENPAAHARTSLVLALLNHNDFVTIR